MIYEWNLLGASPSQLDIERATEMYSIGSVPSIGRIGANEGVMTVALFITSVGVQSRPMTYRRPDDHVIASSWEWDPQDRR